MAPISNRQQRVHFSHGDTPNKTAKSIRSIICNGVQPSFCPLSRESKETIKAKTEVGEKRKECVAKH